MWWRPLTPAGSKRLNKNILRRCSPETSVYLFTLLIRHCHSDVLKLLITTVGTVLKGPNPCTLDTQHSLGHAAQSRVSVQQQPGIGLVCLHWCFKLLNDELRV